MAPTCVMDASALILLAMHCPGAVFPGLWDSVEGLVRGGRAVPPEQVLEEIRAGRRPGLVKWCHDNRRMFSHGGRGEREAAVGIAAARAGMDSPMPGAPNADPHVIARARAIQSGLSGGEAVICTDGSPAKKRGIPYVAREMYGIRSVKLTGLFEEEGWAFVAGPAVGPR